ncbi:SRPBCC family protein [Oceanicella sp. SM1341]|uniref:SRPBCC family protein n=1 Tax=Oceanicella sp. SM1341 TaxID=1548889 RepID=UPI000E491C8E|nr:SRPBCC family protein [Oceanicella sp. SM1341]
MTAPAHELVLDRLLAAPRAAVWRCWTEPDLLKQWYCPAPWTIASAQVDLRPGGASHIVMRSPEGEEFPNRGVYLEVEEGSRLVFTDAYTEAWVPSAKPFFTGIITLADEGAGTRYIARGRHWSAEDCETHDKMGFHEGWGKSADQLEALAATL